MYSKADIETQMRNEQSSMEGATAVLETTEHHQGSCIFVVCVCVCGSFNLQMIDKFLLL